MMGESPGKYCALTGFYGTGKQPRNADGLYHLVMASLKLHHLLTIKTPSLLKPRHY